MSVEQAVTNLARKVKELKTIIETEEATKTAFIIPFISDVLGYDVTDPREVIPEYTADVGTKKGERLTSPSSKATISGFLSSAKRLALRLTSITPTSSCVTST